MRKKITIVVHGRFHAFDLARELVTLGHDATLLTSLPPSRYKPFGLEHVKVSTFWFYGGISRLIRYTPVRLQERAEHLMKPMFSNWAAKKILKDSELTDVVYCFSGVAEELFKRLPDKRPLKLLARGSTHIRYQYELLNNEEKRVKAELEKSSHWMIGREEREYECADRVVVLSTFAHESFKSQGVDNVCLMLSGCQTSIFKATSKDVDERVSRIQNGMPLNVLTVGSFSYRKGIYDLAEVAKLAYTGRFNFSFVGDIAAEAATLMERNKDTIEFIPRVAHFDLPEQYKWADIFFFPTIEDGYPAVLGQAHSMGLPILASTNSSAPDIVRDGLDGKILPAGDTAGFVLQLEEWESNRQSLAKIAEDGLTRPHARDWDSVARRFEEIVQELQG